MSERPINERVAALEVRIEALEDMQDALNRVEATQQSLLAELARYRGAWGAVVLIATAVGTALYLFRDWVVGGLK